MPRARYFALVMLSSAAACARPRGAETSAEATARDIAAELTRLERDIGAANIRRDKAFFARVEADEFLFTASDGTLATKAEDLASLDEKPTTMLTAYDVDDVRTRAYGANAVVWGRVTTTSTRQNGSPFTNRTRFTDVFVRRDGRWQLVAGHSSRLPAK